MAEAELRIPVPEELDAHVKERVAEGHCDAAADYAIALIRGDRERHLHERLDSQLLEGLDSKPEPVTPEYLADATRGAGGHRQATRQDILELVAYIAADNPTAAAASYGPRMIVPCPDSMESLALTGAPAIRWTCCGFCTGRGTSIPS